MEQLLTIRDTVRDFIRKFDEIIYPVFRFIASFIMFSSINSLFGYSELFGRGMVIFLLSVICALVPSAVVVLLGGVVVLFNCLSASTEIGILFLLLFIIMYCLYMRVFPRCSWILALVPILYMINLQHAAPIIVAILAGASGIVPTVFGVVLYNFAQYTEEAVELMKTATEEEFQAYSYIIDNIVKNDKLILIAVVYAVVIMGTHIINSMSFNYSKYISVLVGGILTIIFFPVCSSVLGVKGVEMGSVVLGSILGILVAALIQLCKGILDYSKKESVQFEDDEYYYYVKAIPKLNSPKKQEELKKTAERSAQIVADKKNAEALAEKVAANQQQRRMREGNPEGQGTRKPNPQGGRPNPQGGRTEARQNAQQVNPNRENTQRRN